MTATDLFTPAVGRRRIVRDQMWFQVTTPGAVDVVDGAVLVRVLMRWTYRNPHAVDLTFLARMPVTWPIARDLLVAGLNHPAGIGDVFVMPALDDPYRCELVLSNGTGRAGLRFHTGGMADFLHRTGDLAGGPR